jgi:hypothetical protein
VVIGYALRCIAACLFVLVATVESFSQETQQQKAVLLEQAVQKFSSAMEARDFRQLVEFLPPPLWKLITENAKAPDEQVADEVVKVMEEAFSQVELVEFGMNAAGVELRELADGTTYAFIPTRTVVNVDQPENVAISSNTLGILHEGTWYLMDAEDTTQRAMLLRVYPRFSGVAFPSRTLENVKE